jgi:hypothetical protein
MVIIEGNPFSKGFPSIRAADHSTRTTHMGGAVILYAGRSLSVRELIVVDRRFGDDTGAVSGDGDG